MTKITGDGGQLGEITRFIINSFQPNKVGGILNEEQYLRLMMGYAECAILLSNSRLFANEVAKLENRLCEVYNGHKFRYEVPVSNPPSRFVAKGAFMEALGDLASDLGFSRKLLVLNGGIDDGTFRLVAESGHLFRDVFSASHGEYSHAVQWLVLANALPDRDVPSLYRRSYNVLSSHIWDKAGEKKQITMWEWLVDAFPENQSVEENYTTNLISSSFRSPQNVTRKLTSSFPTGSWLPAFVESRWKKESTRHVRGRVTKNADERNAAGLKPYCQDNGYYLKNVYTKSIRYTKQTWNGNAWVSPPTEN